MLTSAESILVVIFGVIASLLFLALVNRIWPPDRRHAHNDQIGWQLSVLGTTYAVILGFMLYAVWTEFGTADANVESEANDLVSIYWLADGLPDQQSAQLKELALRYADVAINQDWPAMSADRVPNASLEVNARMWKVLMSIKSPSPTESTAQDHALTDLASLTQHRRIRVLESTSALPPVLWWVLVVGGCVTIASSCLFGSSNTLLHFLQVFAFSLLILLGLVAIGEINRPFQGSVHISSYPFVRAQLNMQGIMAQVTPDQ
ncbi:MAG: DUF4239 domain-containing protein [Candidatus Korobacteraceae bacterium]